MRLHARLQIVLILGLIILLLFAEQASANDCGCPTIAANGKGNTSCSTSESNGRCTIDYNLFSPAAERLAAELLAKGGMSVQTPPSDVNSVRNLLELALQGGNRLTDAVLVYLMVATADRSIDGSINNSADIASEVVRVVSPYRNQIEQAFSGESMQRWLSEPDDKLRGNRPPVDANAFAGDQLMIAPGCIEVSTGRFWVMFKASWSPLRFAPRCRRG